MSKEKKHNSQPEAVLTPNTSAAVVASATMPAQSATPPNPKLMDVDKMALDLARERKLTALAEAKTAVAKNDNAELAFKYVVLQIYMKYGLTEADAISEQGEIIKNGAAQAAAAAQAQGKPQGQ